MKNVTLIATGGTIASSAEVEGGAVNAGLTGETLLNSLHERPADIAVTVENFDSAGSYALDLATIHRLCAHIDRVLAHPDVDGVVITHGTDTMEESAFLAWLLVQSDKPVVFTGAQRHAGQPDTDGPRNILDALAVAATPRMHGMGAVILFEGDIHGGRYVTKAHTSRVDTFRSVGLGKLGEVDGGQVHLYARPAHPRRPRETTARRALSCRPLAAAMRRRAMLRRSGGWCGRGCRWWWPRAVTRGGPWRFTARTAAA